MNYKKHILISIIFAFVIGAVSAFFFYYLPYDCNDTSLPEELLLECRTRATLGTSYWLPYSLCLFFFALPFYWAVYGIISAVRCLFKK